MDDRFVYEHPAPRVRSTPAPDPAPPPESLFIMIIGHGTFVIDEGISVNEIREIEFRRIKLTLYTFAPPGETSFYPPERITQMIDTIKDRHIIEGNENLIDDDHFFDNVEYAQIKNIGFTYDNDLWSKFKRDNGRLIAQNGNSANRIRNTNKYYEKVFSEATDDKGKDIFGVDAYGANKSGVYAFSNLRYIFPHYNFSSFQDENGDVLLSNIILKFEGLGIKKLYIFDTTCSVFDNQLFQNTLTDRRIRREVNKMLVGKKGGKTRRKRVKHQKKTIKRKNIKN